MPLEGIRTVETRKDAKGVYQRVRVDFGPHYFVELRRGPDGKVTFVLGATHHGFKADASEVGGELEDFINEIRSAHPNNMVD
jgi:type IV secretory pathway TrbF-like protein